MPTKDVTELSFLEHFIQSMNQKLWLFFDFIGGVGVLVFQTMRSLFSEDILAKDIWRQLYIIGVQSFLLVGLIAAFTGMVMALQFVFGLSRFGLQLYTGQIVGLGLVRELAPVLTALMVAARVGSGITAELGSMTVSEQVMAIRAMGGSPIARLVVPRIMVTTLVTPLLNTMAVFIGITGGMIITMMETGISATYFIDQITTTVEFSDLMSGISKSVFFGFLIGAFACHNGLETKGGTRGVGEATTRTVVACAIGIFISDFFLTKLFIVF